jgi:hypothetical protein
MARKFTELHVKITTGPPYRWEIYRGGDPGWIERAMHGYSTESEALREGCAALEVVKNREVQNRGR